MIYFFYIANAIFNLNIGRDPNAGDLNYLFIFTFDMTDSNIDGVLSRTPIIIEVEP